jgi:peptide/nickel transport system permease protein
MPHHLPTHATRRLWLLPAIGAAAAAAALWQPHDPEAIALASRHAPPSLRHPLGTDHLGRDLLSRLMLGGARTMFVVALVAAAWIAIGCVVGLAAASLRGWSMAILLRLAEFVAVLPSLLAAIVVTALSGFGPLTTGLAIGLTGWGPFALLAFGLARRGLAEPYVLAARALGQSDVGLLRRHVWPIMWETLLSYLGAKLGRVAIAYAALAFLGLGGNASRADWGAMMYEYRLFALDHPMLMIWPGSALMALCLALRLAIGGDSGARLPASSGDLPGAVDQAFRPHRDGVDHETAPGWRAWARLLYRLRPRGTPASPVSGDTRP